MVMQHERGSISKVRQALGKGIVAYFTPEIGIEDSLHIYSGGLGILADSMSRAAAQSDLPFVVVSLLYRKGYYDQSIGWNDDLQKKWMGISYTSRHYDDVLLDCGEVSVRLGGVNGTDVYLRVWKLPKGTYGSSEVILLDADIEKNDPLSRSNTLNLYASIEQGGNTDQRIVQDILLGIGGWKALRMLGHDVKLCHLNEGYPWPVIIAQMQEHLHNGLSIEQVAVLVRENTVFTTHTPVEAGNKKWPYDDVIRILGDDRFNSLLFESSANSVRGFNLTEFCLKHSRISYAVAKKHGEVSRDMWKYLPEGERIIHVTNGQDVRFWQHQDFGNAKTWQELAQAKLLHKRKLLALIQKVHGVYFDEGIPLVAFARRFAGYKRPNLILDDMNWLMDKLQGNKLRLVFAGKPHPEDRRMIEIWSDILQLSERHDGIAILPGYEIGLMKLMKCGADIWLNNPEPPREASGTSGMGAAMNGALNFSTVDGWVVEEFEEAPECFFPFGVPEIGNWNQQWIRDAESLREVYDEQIWPMYRHDKEAWYGKALNAKRRAETRWSSLRMLEDCTLKAYLPML